MGVEATRVVGHIKALYRYPVKSMRGEAITETHVGWPGLPADRRYAFVQAENRSHFPYLTGRQTPDLLRYTPFLVHPEDPEHSAVRVRTPEGEDYTVTSPELLASIAQRYNRPFYLLRLGLTGTFDVAPLSLISTGTLAALGRRLETTLPPLQFRPNILVETPEGEEYPEDQWVGRTLIFGEGAVRMHVMKRDKRCIMITLNPTTGSADPRVLAEVARNRQECAGVYGSALQLGRLAVGQEVRVVVASETADSRP